MWELTEIEGINFGIYPGDVFYFDMEKIKQNTCVVKKEENGCEDITYTTREIGDKLKITYVGFEADSTIYKYKQDEYPIKAFGYKGKNMNQNYQAIRSWEECSKMVSEDRTNKGYYTSLYVSPTDNYIFRTYQKGSHDSTDGLQIYQNEVLIGDVPAPKGIKIIGYIAPYYYATCGIDEENERIELFKFVI